MFRHIGHLILLLCLPSLLLANSVTPASQIPYYYSGIDQQSDVALFNALTKITNHGFSSLGYDGLYDAYPYTDYTTSGDIWDMYSDCGTTTKCGSYGKECDCYNREHSIPKSWWGGSTSGIGCDIFHVIPTDGYVNNRRGNYMFGIVKTASYTSLNGSRLGSSVRYITNTKATVCALAGAATSAPNTTVFEPINDYKGDFARAYLGVILKWNESRTMNSSEGAQFFQGTYTVSSNWGLQPYAVALLVKWHREDPVSQKEIDRNNGIQKTQGNRNPFVDYPYLVEYLWGEKAGQTVHQARLIPSTDQRFIPGKSDGYDHNPSNVEDITPHQSLSSHKVIRNATLYIIIDGHIYDSMGQRIE